MKSIPAQVFIVDAGDLDFSSGRGLHVPGDLHHLIIIEIEPRHRVITLWILRLLLYGQRFTVVVELHHAVLSGVTDIVPEYGSPLVSGGHSLQHGGKTLSVKDIVPQHQSHLVPADEIRSNQKSIRKASGVLLHRIGKCHSKLSPLPQQLLKYRKVSGCGDNEYIANPRQHKC